MVRFARKLGYTGFTEFRAAARHAMLASQESPLSRFSQREPGSLVERKAVQDTKNVLATASLVHDTLAPAAQAVATPAVSSSLALACPMVLLFISIGS